jgi:hypothetical protein
MNYVPRRYNLTRNDYHNTIRIISLVRNNSYSLSEELIHSINNLPLSSKIYFVYDVIAVLSSRMMRHQTDNKIRQIRELLSQLILVLSDTMNVSEFFLHPDFEVLLPEEGDEPEEILSLTPGQLTAYNRYLLPVAQETINELNSNRRELESKLANQTPLYSDVSRLVSGYIRNSELKQTLNNLNRERVVSDVSNHLPSVLSNIVSGHLRDSDIAPDDSKSNFGMRRSPRRSGRKSPRKSRRKSPRKTRAKSQRRKSVRRSR